MKAFLIKKPLISYFICAFGCTWLIVFFLILSGLAADFNHPPVLFLVGAMVSGIFPSVTAIVLTRITAGKEGLHKLLRKFTIKGSGKWYLITLAILPTIAVMTTIISHFAFRTYTLHFTASSLILGLIWPFFSAFGEEIGWRGYVLPKFLSKYSVLKAALLLGVIWATWHLPMYYIGYQGFGKYMIPSLLIPGYLNLIVQSVIMAYLVVRNRGSLKIAVLYHYTITGSALLLGAFTKTSQTSPLYGILESVVTIALCVILATILYGKNSNKLNLEKEEL